MNEPKPHAPSGFLDVLVVEDNPVNQRVVMGLLTRWGHRAVLASDGARCLEVLEQQVFDLVLMDVQMPMMDGIQATCAIRARERSSGCHLPIIAITAHAGKQDRERCLDAGMDRYLTKPINSELLRRTIGELLPIAVGEASAPAPEPKGGPVDFDLLREFVGDDPELLSEVVQIFLDDAPLTLESAERAISEADAHAVEMSAHRLKGSLSTMGAAPAAETAFRLELLAGEGALDGAVELCEQLRREVEATRESLRLWRDQKAA